MNKILKKALKIGFMNVFFTLLVIFAFSVNFSQKSSFVTSNYSKNLNLNIDVAKTASLFELNKNEGKKEFVSEIISPENKFHAITVTLDKVEPENSSIDLLVRYKKDKDSLWSDYKLLREDEEDMNSENIANYFYPIPLSTSYQYKIVLKSIDKIASPKVEAINITTIDSRQIESDESIWDFFTASLDSPKDFDDLHIVSRKEWGANESLMVYENDEDIPEDREMTEAEKEYYEKYGDELEVSKRIVKDKEDHIYKWAITYPEELKLFAIHHTASDYTNLDDTDAAVNSIYYYHTVSRGWGDIGYNFLIDKDGVIYEGRKNSLDALKKGEPMVVGAHATGFNHGSMGIAMLLDAEQKEPSLEAIESLVALLHKASKVYGIDLKDTTSMRGETLPTVVGHRDIGSTKCPGDKLYPLLADIISLSEGEDEEGSEDEKLAYDFEEITDRATISLNPQSKSEMEIKLKNTGTETWKAGVAILLKKDIQAETKIYFTNNVAGKALTTFLMKEKEVKPGATATFVIDSASIIKEGFANFEGYLSLNAKIKSDKPILLPFYVKDVDFGYKVIENKISKTRLSKGEEFELSLKIRNTGNIIWNNDKYSMVKIASSDLYSEQDLSSFGPIKNGGEINIKLKMKAPNKVGKIENNLNFIIGKQDSLTGDSVLIKISVIDTTNAIKLIAKPSKFYFNPAEVYKISLTLQNNSNNILDVSKGNFIIKAIKKASIKIDTINILKEKIKPSEEFDVSLTVTAPNKEGKYVIYLKPLLNNQKLNKDYIKINFEVKNKTSIIEQEPDIRIALDSLNVDSPEFTSTTDFDLYIGKTKYKDLKKGELVKIEKNENIFTVILPDKKTFETSDTVRFVPEKNGILTIVNFDHKPAWDTNNKYNDNMYRGILEARIYEDKLKVINELPLESYLKGLGEVSNTALTEKIKTIMVAARTYALYYILIDSKFEGAPYHLNDDPEVSQKYLGYGLEMRSPNIVEAIEDISGEVVTYNDYLVKTPYFNSTDGTRTKSAEEVWGWTTTPYLISVDDTLCEASSFNGHGVGLSGCGADEMAKLGKKYKEILKYYYTGVEVDDLY